MLHDNLSLHADRFFLMRVIYDRVEIINTLGYETYGMMFNNYYFLSLGQDSNISFRWRI